MRNKTLKIVLSQLEGNDWSCTYMVTNRSLKRPKTTSGRARLIYHKNSLLIRWDNESRIETEVDEIPPASFSEYQDIEYNDRTIIIKVSDWDLYLTLEANL